MAVEQQEVVRGNPPHFPDHDELRNGAPNRIRLGCPLQGEDLVRRYFRVFADLRDMDYRTWDFEAGFNFEWGLADLRACEECQVTDIDPPVIGKDSQGREYRLYHIRGCRTFAGKGMFLDLDRKTTRALGKPKFVVRNCEGPEWRKEQLAGIYEGSASHRRVKKEELVP
jgi:hypothetical protein